jgi:CobQ/CobB/MinD/ParA nucleotide binding domain
MNYDEADDPWASKARHAFVVGRLAGHQDGVERLMLSQAEAAPQLCDQPQNLLEQMPGTGKTSIAAALAVAAEADGERVFLIDGDHEQRSLTAWGDMRKAETPRGRVHDARSTRRLDGTARSIRIYARRDRHGGARDGGKCGRDAGSTAFADPGAGFNARHQGGAADDRGAGAARPAVCICPERLPARSQRQGKRRRPGADDDGRSRPFDRLPVGPRRCDGIGPGRN